MTLQIITNHHERPFLYGYEVPDSVKADFDHLDEDSGIDDGWIHYRNTWYHTSDFMRLTNSGFGVVSEFDNWHGHHGDSFFSGVLIKLSDDGETYQIATYIS